MDPEINGLFHECRLQIESMRHKYIHVQYTYVHVQMYAENVCLYMYVFF